MILQSVQGWELGWMWKEKDQQRMPSLSNLGDQMEGRLLTEIGNNVEKLLKLAWIKKKKKSNIPYMSIGDNVMISMLKESMLGVPVVAQWVKNLTSIHEDLGLILGLSQ